MSREPNVLGKQNALGCQMFREPNAQGAKCSGSQMSGESNVRGAKCPGSKISGVPYIREPNVFREPNVRKASHRKNIVGNEWHNEGE